MDNKVMYSLSYGLFVLSARRGDKDNGCITNTAIQVTTDPNRIVVAINKGNYTHDMVKETGRFTVSVLSEEAKFDLFQRFGFQSGRDADKFAGFQANTGKDADGIPYVTQGTNAWLSCKVVSATDLGTHTLFLADVLDGGVLPDRGPVKALLMIFLVSKSTSLSHCSIAVKRYHGQGNSYKRKHLIGGLLTVLEG